MFRTAALLAILTLATPAALPAGEGHGSCPMKDHKPASTVEFSGEGRLLCMHCNLHRETSCRKVYQASSNPDELIDICPSSKVDLEAVSREGAALLRLTGKMVTSEDGRRMIVVDHAEPVAE